MSYSYRKCKYIFKEALLRYPKLESRLPEEEFQKFQAALDTLDKAIQQQDVPTCTTAAQEVDEFLKTTGKKTWVEHTKEFISALLFALIVVAFIRQMWFELYEIPTGSMRPIFREHDRVVVSKTAYGINTPFQTSHLSFNPDLIQRGSIIVFTVDGMEVPDPDTMYFYLFPGKRRYVKRCIAKPEDTIYFYGGNIYGIDKDGNTFTDDPAQEHIPFLNIDGRQVEEIDEQKRNAELIYKQMNIPIAKLTATPSGRIYQQVFNGTDWKPGTKMNNLWGLNNYAACRLITPNLLPRDAKEAGYEDPNALFYLELRHSPELTMNGRVAAKMSWIPLTQAELDSLKKALYTSRFVVQDNVAYHYNHQGLSKNTSYINLPEQVPNGTYELFDGIPYKLDFFGRDVPTKDFPLTNQMVATLFNSGIEFSDLTNPLVKKRTPLFPARYCYFNDGSLHLMNKPLLTPTNLILTNFLAVEQKRQTADTTFTPFIDHGKPSKDAIFTHGLKIPPKQYLGLGDNHANSLDCRYFGFIPEQNIQGSPILILWPLDNRFGPPPQPHIPSLRLQNVIVVTIAAIASLISLWLYRRSTSHKAYAKLKARGDGNAKGSASRALR